MNRNLTEANSAAPLVNFMKLHLHAFSGTDAVLYLSHNLFARSHKGTNRYDILKGVAYTGGACSVLGCGIIYVDSDIVSSASTITHEVLHIIGSGHDGRPAHDYLKNSPGALKCPDNPKFIMAEYFQPQAETYLPLSTCTRDQVKAFLTTRYGNCLLNNQARKYPPLSQAIFRKPIVDGTRYCKYLHNDTSNVEYVPVCISKICMDIPRKPPSLHNWLSTHASGNFQISDSLHK
ncbi:A disintegrin and metalloproteinase with thrombospondin motifs 10-like [Dermacentor silvarum]|uniref:A disintegrin and metalloproteinase with thrombospondin motifs 10-like n=1 Tax=Dermacentor silvarum TaxID=543639 RepID=UPI0021013EF1|nr:A disintegrin and metalloproteinase with thrombospondin motifs 10-like [Dermacentor silvarum]